MRCFARLLICALLVSGPVQSWAAPMLCQTDSGPDTAELAPEAGHEHHAGMHHDSNTGEHDSDEHSSGDCSTDCQCGHCVVSVALSKPELAAVPSYRGEQPRVFDGHLGPYLDGIFRPPISD